MCKRSCFTFYCMQIGQINKRAKAVFTITQNKQIGEMTKIPSFHLIVLDMPKPRLKGKTTQEIPAVEAWQPPSRSREKSYFTFRFVGNGKGAGGDNVVS